jgi:hypothetical protein
MIFTASSHPLTSSPSLMTLLNPPLPTLTSETWHYCPSFEALPTVRDSDVKSRLNLHMHRALAIEEIITSIVQYLDLWEEHTALVSLSSTCRLFSEPALNVLWQEPPLWRLAQRMASELWKIDVVAKKKRDIYGRRKQINVLVSSLMRVSFSCLIQVHYRDSGRKRGKRRCCARILEIASAFTRRECDPLF